MENSDKQAGPVDVRPSSATSNRTATRRRLLAAALSVILPGLGQWILGERRRGFWFAIAGLSYVVVYFALRVPGTYSGLISSVWLLIGLCVTASWDVMRSKSPATDKLSAWWLPAAFVLGFLATSLYTNALVRANGLQLFSIPSTSMEPSIQLGDHLIVDKHFYRLHKPTAGDVAIFRRGNLLIVKRIICTGGCTVSGRDKALLVGGKELSEPYVIHTMGQQVPAPEVANFGPVRVPDGKLFIVGDNRDVSLDSRTFGPVDASSLIGRPLYVVRPFARAGTIIH